VPIQLNGLKIVVTLINQPKAAIAPTDCVRDPPPGPQDRLSYPERLDRTGRSRREESLRRLPAMVRFGVLNGRCRSARRLPWRLAGIGAQQS
jgi:hypothetical protein